ncbi:rhodanese-like domain-containing protein [Solitalea lacus]|uniref:rhodanese-like domain-containing protein n=1 Tax=Solitalea lacus TaxID=2911172 RepID=UPI001EDC5AAF|nr:rhodanese-like domain-containing protein [Solitalea lacus]UKJ06682.1 rhodanese-like domain-containing protein [Solitalea lacus]
MPKQSVKLIFIIKSTVKAMFGLFKNMFAQDNSQLSEALKRGAFLVDVRTPAEFASGSVKGAVNIPLDRLPNQLAKFKGKETIVVFCRSGNRSSQAKSFLEQNGFQSVINGGTWENIKGLINEKR